jgi:hypothetical protein
MDPGEEGQTVDAKRYPGGRMLLGEILLARGLVTKEQLDQGLRAQVGGLRRLGSILIGMKVLTDANLTDALSEQLGLPVVKVGEEFNDGARNVLPRHLCRKYSVVPLTLEGNNVLRLAMADPLDRAAIADVEHYTGRVVQPVLARLSDIDREIPARMAFSRQDLFNPQVYRTVARVAVGALLVLLAVIGALVYRDVRTQRYGTVSRLDGAVIYKNHDLMIDVAKDGSIFFSGRGAFAGGYYGVRFENAGQMASFVRGALQQFSTEQLEWLRWVFREKLKVAEPLFDAKGP